MKVFASHISAKCDYMILLKISAPLFFTLTGPSLLTVLHSLKYNSPHFPTQISIWSFTPSKFAK